MSLHTDPSVDTVLDDEDFGESPYVPLQSNVQTAPRQTFRKRTWAGIAVVSIALVGVAAVYGTGYRPFASTKSSNDVNRKFNGQSTVNQAYGADWFEFTPPVVSFGSWSDTPTFPDKHFHSSGDVFAQEQYTAWAYDHATNTQRRVCNDGSRPVCANGNRPTRPVQGGRRVCEDGYSPTCANGSRPNRPDREPRVCDDGSQPECGDGSTPRRGRCEDGRRPVCADGNRPSRPVRSSEINVDKWLHGDFD